MRRTLRLCALCSALAALVQAASAHHPASFISVRAPALVPGRARFGPLQRAGGSLTVSMRAIEGAREHGKAGGLARRDALGVAAVLAFGLRPGVAHAEEAPVSAAVRRMRARKAASAGDGVAEERRGPAGPTAPAAPAAQDEETVQPDAETGTATRFDVQEALDTANELGQGVAAGATAAFSAAKAVGQAVAPVVGKAVDVTAKFIDVAVPATTKAVEVATPIVKKGLEVGVEAAQEAANKASPLVQNALEKAQQNPALKETMDSAQPALRATTDALDKIKTSPELQSALSGTKSALEAAAPVAKSAVSGTAKVVVSGSKVVAGTLEVLAGTETKEQLLDTMKNEASSTSKVVQDAAGVALPIASKVAKEAVDMVLPVAKQAGQVSAARKKATRAEDGQGSKCVLGRGFALVSLMLV